MPGATFALHPCRDDGDRAFRRGLLERFDSRLRSRRSAWHGSSSAIGVALELTLRYPQVFPIFVSPLFGNGNGEYEGWAAKLVEEAGGTGSDWANLHCYSPLEDLEALRSAIKRFSVGGLRTDFDPSGLRTIMRNRFIGQVFGGDTDWANTEASRRVLNQRLKRCAVVIEEESELALLTGYAAYKTFGRVWLTMTYAEFLGENARCHWRNDSKSDIVIVRDLDLRFPDFPEDRSVAKSLRSELRNIRSAVLGHPPT